MADHLPSIIVTGASGFVGRHFIDAAKNDYLIYAMARRSQSEAGVPLHQNINWIQVDITNWPALKKIMYRIKELGGVDYVLHLAAFYDFNYDDNPEYTRTNIHGTRHMLEQAKWLCVRRFVFASSVAACRFPPHGGTVTERSPADADFHYARSKKRGEEMLHEYSRWFPCSVVRFAAVFSDWCEYPPLYKFLSTWFSHNWNAQILAGRGESSVSYIHVADLTKFLLELFRRSNGLMDYDVYIASPDGSTSHRELFEASTLYYFGRVLTPIFLSRTIAYPGVVLRDLLGRVMGRRPFERPWMLKYVDRQLNVDASYTRRVLQWEPKVRYHVLRRLLFLIEKMKSRPGEWHVKNEAALERGQERPNLLLFEAISSMQNELASAVLDSVFDPGESSGAMHLRGRRDDIEWYIGIMIRLLTAAVRSGDRSLMLDYAGGLLYRRFKEGFVPSEIQRELLTVNKIVVSKLIARQELHGLGQEIHDLVTLSIQLALDGVEDAYDRYVREAGLHEDIEAETIPVVPPRYELEKIISHLDIFYRPSMVEKNGRKE